MPLPVRLCLSLCIFALIAVPAFADTPTAHTVAWGETLHSIARNYGVSPQLIADANQIRVDAWVYAGQQLTIPGGRSSTVSSVPRLTPTGYYTVKAGDTLYSIATSYKSSVAEIAAANNVPGYGLIYVGWTLKIPAAATTTAKSANALNAVSQTYVVQPGEFLYQIAVRYGTTVQAIAAANNLPSDWLIFAGQRLNIPSKVTNSDLNPPNVGSSGGLNIRITNVPLYRQKQALTCEEASVAMASRGRVSEVKLVAAMPKSDNPFLGIRGRTNAPYYGGLVDYGAYAQALQTGLTKLGIRSEVLYGQPFEEFRESILYHLKAGRPVVWWHTWRNTYQKPVTIKTQAGATVKLVPYEHVGTIVGASDRGATYNDPYDATVQFVSWAELKRVSAYFDNMALVIR